MPLINDGHCPRAFTWFPGTFNAGRDMPVIILHNSTLIGVMIKS